MGTTPQADTPGNVYFHSMPFGSLASNGTDRTRSFFPPGQAIAILSAWVAPDTSQAGSATNYPGVRILNHGTGSAGTAVLAQRNFSGTALGVDAGLLGSMTLGAVVSKASGDQLAVQHEQVANGLDLVPHTVHMAYRYL